MSARTMTPSSATGTVTTVLVLLGLAGSVGWVAAMVLAVLAGLFLGAVVDWMTEAGTPAMDGDTWAPAAGLPSQVSHQPAEAPELPEDDLRQIRGIGEKVASSLRDAGVTRFAQIALWDDAQIDVMAGRIGRPAALIRRDDWVGQARAFAIEEGA
ncbi:MAG: hypothetical protein ACU0DH_09020 [Paracoccus sp. (in: a-proteobacteria)]|uniref:hypothetical protein n=1 Tax=Paracoccus sp. TaxID=267 RepID=UPI0040580F01